MASIDAGLSAGEGSTLAWTFDPGVAVHSAKLGPRDRSDKGGQVIAVVAGKGCST